MSFLWPHGRFHSLFWCDLQLLAELTIGIIILREIFLQLSGMGTVAYLENIQACVKWKFIPEGKKNKDKRVFFKCQDSQVEAGV